MAPTQAIANIHAAHDTDDMAGTYDQWATQYDEDVLSSGYVGPEKVASLLVRSLASDNHAGELEILDVGCGTGLVGLELERLGVSPKFISGCDISPGMLDECQKTACYEGNQGLQVVDVTDGMKEYEDETFDGIVSCGVFTLGHVPPECLAFLLKKLKVGGILVTSTRISYYLQTHFEKNVLPFLASGEAKLVSVLFDQDYVKEDERAHYWVLQKQHKPKNTSMAICESG